MKGRNPIASPMFAALCTTLLAGSSALAASHGAAAAHFDYYLMSLSWSPSYCLTHENDAEECGSHGFGFVLHGLWPQYRNGSWPQHCHTSTAPDRATIERTLAFMPSRHLIEHEWQTHGACSGLDPGGYFELADRAFGAVTIPEALRNPRSPPPLSADGVARAFAASNPGLQRSMFAVVCHDGSELAEVRICLNRDTLSPQACGGNVHSTCRYGTLKIPAVR